MTDNTLPSDSPDRQNAEMESAQFEDIEGNGSFLIPSTDGPLGKVIYVLAVLTALLAILQVMRLPFTRVRYDNFHLALAILLFALVELYRRGDPRTWDRRQRATMLAFGLLMATGFAATVYIELNFKALQTSFIGYTAFQTVLGAILILSAFTAMYWAYGWMITAVAVSALLYARYGRLLPGLLNHAGKEWGEIVSLTVLQVNSGVYHILFHIGATWIFVFLIWAGIVEEMGGLQTFFDIGFLIGSRFKSGIAQTAVVSSMIMGSISGSPMANSIVTGSFTIPLMKERGIAPKTAAAVESIASTGGMVLPPVMGSVAFLMTTFLNVSYGHIIVVAAIPAILFYIAVALAVHLIIIDLDVDAMIDREVEPRQVASNFLPILVSLVVLVYLLLVVEYSPGVAGVWTMVTLVATEGVKQLLVSDNKLESVAETAQMTFDGLRTGTVRMVPISVTLAAIGVLITAFTMTGIGYRLSTSVVSVAGGNVVILLVLVMVSSILLGMGMPTVAAYLLTITLIAPAMVQVGFKPITAHFFVFYYAMLASVTPPIALVNAVTCKIADADFLDVSVESLKIGLPLFLLPWVFAFNESLLILDGVDTLIAFVMTLVGYLVLTFGLNGGRSTFQIGSVTATRGGRLATRFALVGGGLLLVFLPALPGISG